MQFEGESRTAKIYTICKFFRANSNITDIVFVFWQHQEKCQEQNRELYVTFVDLMKAFNIVGRGRMMQIMKQLGFSPKFLNIIIQLHKDLSGQVRGNSDLSEPFLIPNGVKQHNVTAIGMDQPLLDLHFTKPSHE